VFTVQHLKRFLASLILFFTTLLVVTLYFDHKFQLDSANQYQKVSEQNEQLLHTLIKAKQEKVALIALSLANDNILKQSLIQQDASLLTFNKFVDTIAENSSLQNVWVQVIDADGRSFFRSWVDKKGDLIIPKRKDLQLLYESSNPQSMNTVSVGKFDLSFKTIIPLFDGDEFLGAFEVIAKFNSITDKLYDKGFASVILVDENYREQIEKPFTKRFMDDSYVANLNANDELISTIKSNRLTRHAQQNSTFYTLEKQDLFVYLMDIVDVYGQHLATYYLFQSLKPIVVDIKAGNSAVYGYLTLFYLLSIILYIAWFSVLNFRIASHSNKQLKTVVKTKDEALENQANLWQHVIDGLDDLVLVIDKQYQIQQMNQAAKIFNKDSTSLCTQQRCHDLLFNLDEPCHEKGNNCPLKTCFETGQPSTVVQKLTTPSGEPCYIEFTASPLMNKEGEIDRIIEIGHDITPYMLAKNEVELQKDKLDYIAYHDSLTSLPNRLLFMDRLKQSFDHSQRSQDLVGVLFIDLDRFKEINDTYGHKVGDRVLQECAKRLKSAVRNSDTVSRLGGDEFTVIIDRVKHSDVMVEVVKNILSTIRLPCLIQDKTFHLTASIGVSIFPNDGHSIHDLLKNADTAMYQAKDAGRNSYAFYNPVMTQKALQRIKLEDKIREAISEHQFVMFYQPQYDVNSHKITGFEALIRWIHPKEGIISPEAFIPLAEETGLIMQIGEQVMKMAMSTVADWHHKSMTTKRVAINVSAKQFNDKALLNKVKKALKESDCKPEWIELEITESSVMDNQEYAVSVLNELQEMGITVSIDDFGTGYSSLAQLKRMPINKLKIDQSFVQNVPQNSEDVEITKAIISMAKSLNMDMIAEGIETTEQSDFINQQGCVNVQGYLYSYPVNQKQIERLLTDESNVPKTKSS